MDYIDELSEQSSEPTLSTLPIHPMFFAPPVASSSSSSSNPSNITTTASAFSTSTQATSRLTDESSNDLSVSQNASDALLLCDDDSMIFDGFSQDMADFVDASLADHVEPPPTSQDMDMGLQELQCPALYVHNAEDSGSASNESDLDVDADHELLDEAMLSHPWTPALADITNDELEEALLALDLDKPIAFPPEASRFLRRSTIKQKLCDYAISLTIQLTLSTTPDLISTTPQPDEDMQLESQYRTMQAKIAKRGSKLPHNPIQLKLRNRHGSKSESAFKTLTFPTTVASTKQLAVILRLLDLLTDCLADEGPSTLRDIYYRDAKLFGSQKVVDTLVDDIAATLGIRRRDLNVVAASKGLVHGFIQLHTDQGHVMDCQTASTGHLIPPGEMITAMTINPAVKFVLVVEKEAVFQTLCSNRFTKDGILGKSILITGKGYPDVATRELVRALCNQLPHEIPILCLVDADPHGLHIFLNYRNGSKAMSFDSINLVSPRLKWLGLSSDDMANITMDQDCRVPLTPHDVKKGISLLQISDLDADMRRHVQHLLHSRAKAEIQLLASEDPSGLLSYLRAKIIALIAPV